MSKENKEKNEIADISDEMTEEIRKKHEEQKIKYPQWMPTKENQNLNCYISDITVMKDFNGIGKHAVLMILHTQNEKYPKVSFFPNSICLNQFEKFTTQKSFGLTSESLKEALMTLQGRTFNILYKGEKPASQKGFQNYKDFGVIETTGQ